MMQAISSLYIAGLITLFSIVSALPASIDSAVDNSISCLTAYNTICVQQECNLVLETDDPYDLAPEKLMCLTSCYFDPAKRDSFEKAGCVFVENNKRRSISTDSNNNNNLDVNQPDLMRVRRDSNNNNVNQQDLMRVCNSVRRGYLFNSKMLTPSLSVIISIKT
eukprot:Awhi_evm1s13911